MKATIHIDINNNLAQLISKMTYLKVLQTLLSFIKYHKITIKIIKIINDVFIKQVKLILKMFWYKINKKKSDSLSFSKCKRLKS